jgi:hypothetical protein
VAVPTAAKDWAPSCWTGPAQGGRRKCDWLRVDMWTANERLQHYLRQGFTYVRTVVLPQPLGSALPATGPNG